MILVLHNPSTMKPAKFWIDLKAKKITKSVVNGQEMNLNTGMPYAIPLAKP
jgi:hypothetical protein